jgi:hypothetical protein
MGAAIAKPRPRRRRRTAGSFLFAAASRRALVTKTPHHLRCSPTIRLATVIRPRHTDKRCRASSPFAPQQGSPPGRLRAPQAAGPPTIRLHRAPTLAPLDYAFFPSAAIGAGGFSFWPHPSPVFSSAIPHSSLLRRSARTLGSRGWPHLFLCSAACWFGPCAHNQATPTSTKAPPRQTAGPVSPGEAPRATKTSGASFLPRSSTGRFPKPLAGFDET